MWAIWTDKYTKNIQNMTVGHLEHNLSAIVQKSEFLYLIGLKKEAEMRLNDIPIGDYCLLLYLLTNEDSTKELFLSDHRNIQIWWHLDI